MGKTRPHLGTRRCEDRVAFTALVCACSCPDSCQFIQSSRHTPATTQSMIVTLD